jgi:hypothetical protein
MRYASAEAFRMALEERLKAVMHANRVPTTRLRKAAAFDRFLARLAAAAHGRWMLKGALALDLRLDIPTRTTRDIDIGRHDDEHAATADLVAAQAADAGDFFSFAVERTPAFRGAESAATRYRARAELAGRLYEQFPVDVGFAPAAPGWEPERLRGSDLLAFAQLAPIAIPVIALELHVAEKVHAHTRTYADQRPSTRVKDLIDLALIASAATLDAQRLHAALAHTFASRNAQPPPPALPPPPEAWTIPYARMADEVRLSPNLAEGHGHTAALLDPVLAGRDHGQWHPARRLWIP